MMPIATMPLPHEGEPTPPPSARFRAHILIIEDDADQVRLYTKGLRGYRITSVASASTALQVLDSTQPDLIILDHVLAQGERGADFLPHIKAVAAHVPVIMVSGTLQMEDRIDVLSGARSAQYVLEKPVRLQQLRELVARALDECGLGETVEMLRSLERSNQIEHNAPERQFTQRLARQHALVTRFRDASEKPNISALSREFGVDRRTIQRDLTELVNRGQIAESVYPESDAG